ncbi:MAG: hypothetical protein ACI9HK_003845, partial [Pirellulaceae bacterium]
PDSQNSLCDCSFGKTVHLSPTRSYDLVFTQVFRSFN